jgi:hypothetical protein
LLHEKGAITRCDCAHDATLKCLCPALEPKSGIRAVAAGIRHDHSAAQNGDEFIVASSALWRFLFDPAEYAMNTHHLGGMAQNNGSALLAASLDLQGEHWGFQLFAMPRWSAF